jgi:methyl-accepting chemotaxis protein II, aspartate sensor receptor
VEEAAAAAESLQDQASTLSEAVATFKIASAGGRLRAPALAAPARTRRAPKPALPDEDEWKEF